MKDGIDCGHLLSGVDTGAYFNKYKEELLTREVGKLVISKLIALGDTVTDCTPFAAKSVEESLHLRCAVANRDKVDRFVSIHFNAGKGNGTEIYTYGAKHTNEAENILKNFAALGLQNRGIKDGKGLYVIRNTDAPAMLIECCFIDSSDMQKYNAENFANAIVKGLTGKLPGSKTYHVQIGSFGNKSNAEDLKKNLINKGYSAFIKEE